MTILNNIISFDIWTQNTILHFRGDFLNKFFTFFTDLGWWPVIALLLICISILFYYYNKKNLIWPFAVTILGSGITAMVLKYSVGRARPESGLALIAEDGPSFPSAHAGLILALFGFLVFVICKYSPNLGMMAKVIVSVALSLIIILVGFSRIYLGVHFLSDVLAGYLVGFIWIFIGVYISRKKIIA